MSKLKPIKASLANHIVQGSSGPVIEAALAGFILFEQGSKESLQLESFQLGGVTPENLGQETRAILKANNCLFFFTDEPPSIMIYPPK